MPGCGRFRLCPGTPRVACLPSFPAVWPALVGKCEKQETRQYLLSSPVTPQELSSRTWQRGSEPGAGGEGVLTAS